MSESFKEIFGGLQDPRVERTKKHRLLDIIALGILGTMAGAQGSIESMHWSLDVTFREDACRVRHEIAALNLSWIRKMSLSFLKADTSFKASIRRKQLKLWSSPSCFLNLFPSI